MTAQGHDFSNGQFVDHRLDADSLQFTYQSGPPDIACPTALSYHMVPQVADWLYGNSARDFEVPGTVVPPLIPQQFEQYSPPTPSVAQDCNSHHAIELAPPTPVPSFHSSQTSSSSHRRSGSNLLYASVARRRKRIAEYRCELPGCPATFTEFKNKRLHEQKHRGEAARPACPICGRNYSDKSNLRRHRKAKHPEITDADAQESQ